MNTIENASQEHSLTPLLNTSLLRVRERDTAVKLFYAEMRELRSQQYTLFDIGSTIEDNPAEQAFVEHIVDQAHQESLRNGDYVTYASSWGEIRLRNAISNVFSRWGNVIVDPQSEVMVTKGINNAIWTCIRSIECTHIIVPSWAPYVVKSFALAENKECIDVPLNLTTGNFDLDALADRITSSKAQPGKMLMYMTLPSMPPGTIPEEKFMEQTFIPFLKRNGIFLISDSYIFNTTFDNNHIRPLLSYAGAKDVAVEAITVSKEIGLPGIRAGGVAGNAEIINCMRVHAASMVDIISAATQNAAAAAFEQVEPNFSGKRVRHETLHEIFPRFESMHWPFIQPRAGIDMLVAVPPNFITSGFHDPSLLASFSLLHRFGVAFCPGSVYGEDGKFFLRLVLKQSNKKIQRALDHLVKQKFDWSSIAPTNKDLHFVEKKLSSLDLTKL